jgi:hypothetical protein
MERERDSYQNCGDSANDGQLHAVLGCFVVLFMRLRAYLALSCKGFERSMPRGGLSAKRYKFSVKTCKRCQKVQTYPIKTVSSC